MPPTGVHPAPLGAEIGSALQTLVSRPTDPLDSAVLAVTQFQAGDAYNVIPETATLRGGVRTLREDTRQAMEAAMERIVSGICEAHGARYDFTYTRGYPPTVNAEEETANAAAAAADVVGEDNVQTDIAPVMGSEDFSYMLEKKPGSYIFIGNGDGEGSCMVHNPGYDFNDEVLTIGARDWSRLVETQPPK